MSQTDATVFVVDDDEAVRRSLARLVRSCGFMVKTFASPAKFLNEKLPDGPSCVLLDMCMDGLNGLDVQQKLRSSDRQVPVIFLSGHGTVLTATAGIKGGAEDFLEKPVCPTALMSAICRALERDKKNSAERLERAKLKERYQTMTSREQEVMKLVITGLLNKQAASELGISEKTIKVHRARVMEKMQVESLASLVRMAERVGVVPAELNSGSGETAPA